MKNNSLLTTETEMEDIQLVGTISMGKAKKSKPPKKNNASKGSKEASSKKKRRYGPVRIIVLVIAILAFLGGLVYALYPTFHGMYLDNQMDEEVARIKGLIRPNIDSSAIVGDDETPVLYAELYRAMREYNDRLYYEAQSGLSDAWSYRNPAFDLEEYGVEDGSIGYITIPKIEVEMPIYLGATYAHMAAGAAQLSETSMPIGGVNTNCVIAGHNTWGGAAYFHRLSEMEVGDYFYITNLWDTLTYRVSEVKTINPRDVDQILIQPGKDMVTLMTCWPTGSGGRYRLVVYGERVYDTITTVGSPTDTTE